MRSPFVFFSDHPSSLKDRIINNGSYWVIPTALHTFIKVELQENNVLILNVYLNVTNLIEANPSDVAELLFAISRTNEHRLAYILGFILLTNLEFERCIAMSEIES